MENETKNYNAADYYERRTQRLKRTLEQEAFEREKLEHRLGKRIDQTDDKVSILQYTVETLRQYVDIQIEKVHEHIDNSLRKFGLDLQTMRQDTEHRIRSLQTTLEGRIADEARERMKGELMTEKVVVGVIGQLQSLTTMVEKYKVKTESAVVDAKEYYTNAQSSLRNAEHLFREYEADKKRVFRDIEHEMKTLASHNQVAGLELERKRMEIQMLAEKAHYALKDVTYSKLEVQQYLQEKQIDLQEKRNELEKLAAQVKHDREKLEEAQARGRDESQIRQLKFWLDIAKGRERILREWVGELERENKMLEKDAGVIKMYADGRRVRMY